MYIYTRLILGTHVVLCLNNSVCIILDLNPIHRNNWFRCNDRLRNVRKAFRGVRNRIHIDR